MDPLAAYMAQFGSDSDSDEDGDFDPGNNKEKEEEEEKIEKIETNIAENTEKTEEKLEKEGAKEVKKEEEHKKAEEPKTYETNENHNSHQKTENSTNTEQTPVKEEVQITLDNDEYIPVKKLTDQEKKIATQQINDYFAAILGDDVSDDDEEEDEDDAEYTDLSLLTKKVAKNDNSNSKETHSDYKKKETKPINKEEILEPLEKIAELISGCENASNALVVNQDNPDLLKDITHYATTLLFLGFPDIYMKNPEEIQNIIKEIKEKLV